MKDIAVLINKSDNQQRYHFLVGPVCKKKEIIVPKSLFERIGGEEAVDAAVELFYNKVLADTRINSFFKKTDLTKQRQMQKQFLTFAFGGTTKWNGRNMRAAHKNMNLDDDHFEAVAEDLAATL